MRGLCKIGWFSLWLAVAACTDFSAVRLAAGRSDTVIVNSRGAVPLTVRSVDVNGVERKAKDVQLRAISGSDVELTDDGLVTCNGRSDAVVEATRGNLRSRIAVMCRPIAGFRVGRFYRLTIGGPPVPLGFVAIGLDGKPVDAIAGTVSVRDSQVVAYIGENVHALARGETMVDVEAGDCALSVLVEVVEPVDATPGLRAHQQYAESLSMAVGELRSWRVPPGRYNIALLNAKGAPAHLQLASYQMNCAALRGTEQRYSCIAKDRASVIVQHTRRAGTGDESTATLLVHRRAELGTEPGWSQRMIESGCPLF